MSLDSRSDLYRSGASSWYTDNFRAAAQSIRTWQAAPTIQLLESLSRPSSQFSFSGCFQLSEDKPPISKHVANQCTKGNDERLQG